MAETVDLAFLGRLVEQTLTEVKALRREVADVRTLAIQGVEFSRRLERRMGEIADDLQIVVKSEIMGRLGHFEATMEGKFDQLSERIGEIERVR